MNKYVKEFLQRGMAFGGFGPIVMGIVYFILSVTLDDFSLGGGEVFVATVSTYLLAFVHAGASVFNQIEEWPIAKSLLVHFATLYLAYLFCYLVNSWIPFKWAVVGIFTAIFVVGYFAVWTIVLISIKATEKRLNKRLR